MSRLLAHHRGTRVRRNRAGRGRDPPPFSRVGFKVAPVADINKVWQGQGFVLVYRVETDTSLPDGGSADFHKMFYKGRRCR